MPWQRHDGDRDIAVLSHMTKKIILVIEDEEPLVETLRIKLEKEGFTVETAEDGEAGIKKAEAIKPGLILLDLMLPKVKGEDVLTYLKKHQELKNIPVIIISNSGQPVEIKALLASGADDYIIKADFTIDDILERVHNTLGKLEGRPDVLVAEDETFLRTVLAKKLRIMGFRVLTTLDGDITLKTILEMKPKVVLLDLLMPGLSGLEVLNALKDNPAYERNGTKVVILSNYSGKEREPVITEMTSGYFIKSNFDIDDIVLKVKELLSNL